MLRQNDSPKKGKLVLLSSREMWQHQQSKSLATVGTSATGSTTSTSAVPTGPPTVTVAAALSPKQSTRRRGSAMLHRWRMRSGKCSSIYDSFPSADTTNTSLQNRLDLHKQEILANSLSTDQLSSILRDSNQFNEFQQDLKAKGCTTNAFAKVSCFSLLRDRLQEMQQQPSNHDGADVEELEYWTHKGEVNGHFDSEGFLSTKQAPIVMDEKDLYLETSPRAVATIGCLGDDPVFFSTRTGASP
jgi:hypothetical protein